SSPVRMSRISIGTRRRNRLHINSRDSIPPVVHLILEYRQPKWSARFSHRVESRIEISTELDDLVARLSDRGGRKPVRRSGSVRSIPDSSSLGEGSWCCSRESNSRGLQRPHSSSTIRFLKSLSSVFAGPWTRIGRIRFCPIL